ncbi:MAG: nuclear transport factor 2 family protein [Pyrinomonadaceae bacterium]
MKRIVMVLMIAIGVSSVAFGQTKMSKDNKIETQLIALEKQSWQEWKNKNGGFFQTLLTDEAVNVGVGGLSNKSQIVKSTTSDCEIKSFSVDNFKVVMLDKDAALLTYTAMQDGVCGGKTIPSKVLASSVYVKRGGKWLNAFYQETPPAQ